MYIPFITGEIDDTSNREAGVFQAAYRLWRHDTLPDYEQAIQTDRPGYIVYEDAHQLVAEPFSDFMS
jgi:hypothetical protein